MNLKTQFLTENECFILGKKMKPVGIMVHSTGANNPFLRRYVQPDDGELGKNYYGNHFNSFHPDGRKVCVHAFIGQLADGSIATYQTLPWDTKGWHSGGSANESYIGFEICEDGLFNGQYFSKVYKEAVELTAYLCQKFGIDPMNDGAVICHSEGHKRGIASNHGDVMHWFPLHGKSMDDFRADVKKELQKEEPVTQEQFDAMMERWLVNQSTKVASDWARDFIEKAVALGITDGSRPQSFATREEVDVMILNALKLGGLS